MSRIASISSFKARYVLLKSLKTEIEHTQHLLEVAKLNLQKDFDAWWRKQSAITPVAVSRPASSSHRVRLKQAGMIAAQFSHHATNLIATDQSLSSSQGLGTSSQGLGTTNQSLSSSHGLGTSSQGLGTSSQGLGTSSQGLGTTNQSLKGLDTSSQGLGTSSQGLGTTNQSLSSSQGLGTSSQGLGTSSQGLGTTNQSLKGLDTSSQGLGTSSQGLSTNTRSSDRGSTERGCHSDTGQPSSRSSSSINTSSVPLPSLPGRYAEHWY